MLTLGQTVRLRIVENIAMALRVPFDPYRAHWVWHGRSKIPSVGTARDGVAFGSQKA